LTPLEKFAIAPLKKIPMLVDDALPLLKVDLIKPCLGQNFKMINNCSILMESWWKSG